MISTRDGSRIALLVSAGLCVPAYSQVIQEPIGARLEYQVALPGGEWGSSVTIQPGERVEWRVRVSYTGPDWIHADGVGRVYYQPVFSNVDNEGEGAQADQLGVWRNNGASGQGNTTLQQGLLNLAEGAASSELASYGRVRFGFTSRSTTAGSSGPLMGHRHTSGSNSAPEGSFLRVAGSNNTQWYPPNIPNGSVALNNRLLWGVVSDNPSDMTNTWYTPGLQDVVVFRQAFVASEEAVHGDSRVVTLFSEAATLQRAGGSSGMDDVRFMSWWHHGEFPTTYRIRTGVEYIPATITIVPTPPAAMLAVVGVLFSSHRRRER